MRVRLAAILVALALGVTAFAQGTILAVTQGFAVQRSGDFVVNFTHRCDSLTDPTSLTFVADTAEVEPPFTCAWDLSGKEVCGDSVTEKLPDGGHIIALTVTDAFGRAGTASQLFTVERSEPLLAQTVGLFINDPASYDGYTLFPPLFYNSTYLIDGSGLLINSWPGDAYPGQSAYLLENGHLLRPQKAGNTVFTEGGAGGRIKELDWDGTTLWDYSYSSSLHCQHHDIERLPNGNVLLIAWELKTQAEAIAAGRNVNILSSAGLWPDHIVEVQPDGPTGGTIVWEWHIWDHLIQEYDSSKANYGTISDHPELINLNYSSNGSNVDWTHINSVRYNPDFDQILLSVHNLSEIWVIDHSTTTAEAAGHTGGNSGKGGDLLYRWGNPRVYRRGATTDRTIYYSHDAQWVTGDCPGAGNILFFNNGTGRPEGNYSSADEITPPVDGNGNYYLASGTFYGPLSLAWTYTATPPSSWYANGLSGAQRMPNGNTLICSGPSGTFFEVTTDGTTVWKYINPVTVSGPVAQGSSSLNNNVHKIRRYPPDYPGLAGRDLRPGCTVEIDACYPALRLGPADPGQALAMLPLDPVRDLYTDIGATTFNIPNDASPEPPLIFYGIPDATLLNITKSGPDVTLSFSL